MRIVGQSGPALDVRVVNQPTRTQTVVATAPSGFNVCQQVARLGAGEPRVAWIARIEQFIEERPEPLVSISYPPGDGVDVALVCFSSARPP